MSSQSLSGIAASPLRAQDSSRGQRVPEQERVKKVTDLIFEYLKRVLSDESKELNPLKEELKGKAEKEQYQIVEKYLSKLSSNLSSIDEEFERVSLKYKNAKKSFLDPLQVAISDLLSEEDYVTREAINFYIADYIKELFANREQTELTKIINQRKIDEARGYISAIPEKHRKAFFQIVEKSGTREGEGFGRTILHNAAILEDANLIDEIFDKLKDIPREELKVFLERKSVFSIPYDVYFDVLSFVLNFGSLKIFNKLIEKLPEDILVNMFSSNILLQAFVLAFIKKNVEKYEERVEILRKILEKIEGFSADLQKRCILPCTLLKIIRDYIPKVKVTNFPFSDIIENILKIVKDDELKFSLLRGSTDSSENLLKLAIKQKNEKLVLVILKAISQFSSDLQKKLIPSNVLLQKIRMISEKSNSDFQDFINFMSLVKDEELKFSLLSATTSLGRGLLKIAMKKDNEQLALAILSTINQLKDEDKNKCLSFKLLASAVVKQMKLLVSELLKSIPQALKHEYLKNQMRYIARFSGVEKKDKGNVLEFVIERQNEEIAILIFKEILKLGLQGKRDCINSNLLYKALKHKMLELAKLILSSIKSGENNLGEAYFIEFLQHLEEGNLYFLLKDKIEKVLQLTLKSNYVEISQMILEHIQKLDIKDQIKCLFPDHNIFQYLFWMKENSLLKEIIDNILKNASEEEKVKFFNEDGIVEKRRFLEAYLMKSVDKNDFITVFKMIPKNYAHLYLKHSLLGTVIFNNRDVIAYELLNIIKSFNDNNQKAEVLYEMRMSVLFDSVKKQNLDLTKAILSVFESCPDEQWKLLRFSNSIKTTALHYAARLKKPEDRKNIIKMLLEATPKEKRLEFLQMEESLQNKSVLTMLEKDELEKYVYPLLTSQEQEKLSSNRPKKKAKFGNHQFQPSSSSSSSSSSESLVRRKRKR